MGLTGLMALTAFTACSNDNVFEDPEDAPQTMTVIASPASFIEVNRWSTRALPTGYVAYNYLYPTTTPPNTTIGVFMTPERADALTDFVYEGYDSNGVPTNEWKSEVKITDQTQYYIYGFMPREDAVNVTITDLDGNGPSDPNPNWRAGAKMSLRMNTLTAADVCLIVGVKKYENATPHQTPPPIEDSGIQLGKFGYEGGPRGTNFVYLLLKHIYAALHFQMSLDQTYASLRTIRVTRMELIADDAPSDLIDLDVTLRANDVGDDPVESITYTTPNPPITSPDDAAVIFPWTGSASDFVVPTYPSFSSHIGCYAPNSCNNFTLKTTFDVYDKNPVLDSSGNPVLDAQNNPVIGNLTRKGAVAENKINVEAAVLTAGDVYTVNLIIKPSYLYILAEQDLDNPTIALQ